MPLRVSRLDDGPDLVIEDGDLIAKRLFADPLIAAYDEACGTEPTRFTDHDIKLLARPMMVRRAAERYGTLPSLEPPISFLDVLGPDRDLFSIAEKADLYRAILTIVTAVGGLKATMPYVAGATKLLHLKRPSFVPILDSLILAQLGVREESLPVVLMHFAGLGVSNQAALDRIGHRLALAGHPRPRVRILEGILWATHPASSGRLPVGEWETVIRRRSQRGQS